MTNEEALEKQEALQAFSALEANAAWRTEIRPLLENAYEEHLEGCTARGKSAEQRAQHVEAFHLAQGLRDLIQTRREKLKKELESFAAEARNRAAL